MDIDSFLDTENKSNPQPAPENAPDKVIPASELDENSIDGLIKIIKINMTQNKFDVAERMYIKAKEMFAEETKKQHEEQNRIYSELENINRSMVHGLTVLRQETEKKVQIIQQLVIKANERLSAGELQVANQLYEQIDQLFKSLPDVVPEQKIKLETDIAQLHLQLSSKNNIAANSDFRTKFSNIRNLLGFALDHVQKGNMNEAVQLYHKINKLYDEMPAGFLYEKAMLYKEILKLFKAIHQKGNIDIGAPSSGESSTQQPATGAPEIPPQPSALDSGADTGIKNADEPPPPPP